MDIQALTPRDAGAVQPITARSADRRALRKVLDSLILHLHPTRVPARAIRFSYTWGLGGISTLLCLIQGLTGILLMFRYEPTVERAYLSIQLLESEVLFGALIRGLHHWSANLLVVTAFLHLLRVFFTGGYKEGRRLNWAIGMGLLVLVLAFNFTGYLLPWDQLAYWAVTVSTTIVGYIPLVGRELSTMLLGGPEVGQAALRNFFAMHVALLPAVLFVALGYHFWRIRKDGGISQPRLKAGEQVERVTTVPHLVRREVAVGVGVLVLVTLFSMAVPAPLGPIADPLRSPNPAKAGWYFGGLQELLLHMTMEAALAFLLVVFGVAVAIPWLDRRGDDIGVYFRSRVGRQSALFGAVLSFNLVPLFIIADAYLLDWNALLPQWPTALANGLLPLLLIGVVLVFVYVGARALLRANHSEALVALFSFVIVGLIVFTLTMAFFRGANMDLVLPGEV